jgi:hypothetical protein
MIIVCSKNIYPEADNDGEIVPQQMVIKAGEGSFLVFVTHFRKEPQRKVGVAL